MPWYNADLHVHSVLSPCGGLEMSPVALMKRAREVAIDIISITDHNSFRNSGAYAEAAEQEGISYIYGAEIQSAEEIHLLAFFADLEPAMEFNKILHEALLPVKNDPEFFGDQVVVDKQGNILGYEETALINSTIWTMDEVIENVEKAGGFAFPAHIDASNYGLISQLGLIPEPRNFIAAGITAGCDREDLIKKFPVLNDITLIRNSDAHYLEDVGSGMTRFYLEQPILQEIILACRKTGNRKIQI